VQTKFKKLPTAKTTSSTVFSSLHSFSLFTSIGTKLLVLATYSVSSDQDLGIDVDIRLLIDGVPWEGAGNTMTSPAQGSRGIQSGKIVALKLAVPPGNHTATLEWKIRSAAGTARCDPTTGIEHADLTMQECTT